MTKIFVSSNKNPDLDGYACAVGYAEFLNKTGKNAQPILLGEIEDETKFVLKLAELKPLEIYEGLIDSDIVLVDSSHIQTIGREVDPKKLVEIIDHRRVNNSDLYPWAKVQNELVGSCATLITEKFINDNIVPSIESAYLLYGAIVSNTINFKNKITTDRDHKAANYLKTLINIPENFAEEMFKARTNIEGENLSRYLHKDFVQLELSGEKFTVFQMEIIRTNQVVKNRLEEIKNILQEIVKDKDLDFYFLNMIDTSEAFNYIICPDQNSRRLLEKVLELKFDNDVAKTGFIIMRKEIMSLIKDYLQENEV